jgi:predicted dehydrogenase
MSSNGFPRKQGLTVVSRRAFLAVTTVSAVRILGANDRIRCATIGTGGRGYYLTTKFKEQGVEVAAVCDVYAPRVQECLKAASPGAKAYEDYRRLLEDKSIDAVIIATPDHWHAQMAIDAVEAGKDIYVEKPLAHTVQEGFRAVEAVRRTKRLAQVGTQRRSYDLYQDAKQLLDSGILGQARLVNSWWLNRWDSLGTKPLEGKLNWELFLGPAPKRELELMRFYHWLQFWDYSGGILIGQAAHIVDSVQWMMNSSYPLAVTCSAGKVNLPGVEIPETSCMTVEYPENYLLVFTIGYQAMHYNSFNDQLMQFHGASARLDLGRESYSLYPQSDAVDLKLDRQRRMPGSFEPASSAHIRNFLECLRSRKEPNAPIEVGNSTNIALCMAIESLRTGRRVKWNAVAKQTES